MILKKRNWNKKEPCHILLHIHLLCIQPEMIRYTIFAFSGEGKGNQIYLDNNETGEKKRRINFVILII